MNIIDEFNKVKDNENNSEAMKVAFMHPLGGDDCTPREGVVERANFYHIPHTPKPSVKVSQSYIDSINQNLISGDTRYATILQIFYEFENGYFFDYKDYVTLRDKYYLMPDIFYDAENYFISSKNINIFRLWKRNFEVATKCYWYEVLAILIMCALVVWFIFF